MGTKSRGLAIGGLLLIALSLRIGCAIWWQHRLPQGRDFHFPDSDSYWQLARTIARGQPYRMPKTGDRVFRTPGYPAALSVLFLGDDHPDVMLARLINAFLGTLTVGGIFWLARICLDETSALTAGAMVAFYPGAIAMSAFVLAEAPFCLCMIGQFILWTRCCQPFHGRQAVLALLAGGTAGIATLVRPSWLLFTPFAIAIGLVSARHRAMIAQQAPWLLMGLALVMAPWWIRNFEITGRWVPTTLQVGASLYDGLHPGASGGSDMRFVENFRQQQRRADAENHLPLESTFEYRLDRRMRNAAVAWARTHPWRVVQLAWIKLGRMWNPWPNEPSFRTWPIRLVVMLGYLPLIALAIWGAIQLRTDSWPITLCALPAVYFTLLHIVFVSSIRYRQPAMLPAGVLAAAGLSAIWRSAGPRCPSN